MKKTIFLIVLTSSWLLSGCGSTSQDADMVVEDSSASVVQVVDKQEATPTEEASAMPLPTSTNTLEPSPTPIPTSTPIPPTKTAASEQEDAPTEVQVTRMEDMVGTWKPEDDADYVLTFQPDGILLHKDQAGELISQGRGEFEGEIFHTKSITTGFKGSWKVYVAVDGSYLRFDVIECESWYQEIMWTGRHWLKAQD